jgi:hypothetical protein
MEVLTLSSLKTAARDFCVVLSATPIPNLYGVTDGKAVGTFVELTFNQLDEIGREILAERILQQPPEIGYLTISNALQWRLQYSRIIQVATTTITVGIENLLVG